MFKVLSSREIYKNKWLKLREDIIERASGAKGIYTVVEKNDFAVVIAIKDKQIQLVTQFRHPIQQRALELPMGAWPEKPDADPTELALGELQEETGYKANHIEKIGFQYVDNGGATVGAHIFFATDLTFVGKNLDAEEEDLESLEMPVAEFEAKIVNGDVTDATSIAAFALARFKGLI
jgi:8-oxo-dGTP pyrophosphatase MutT (NUDIX family)